jgi:hypothetical protein
MWLGWARLRTVLLKSTNNSSCSLRNIPVRGWSPFLITMPSLTHCQNWVWVVQNCFLSRQITRAVFFFLIFFFLSFFGFIFFHQSLAHTGALACTSDFYVGKWPHTVPRREASHARQHQVVKENEYRIANFGSRISGWRLWNSSSDGLAFESSAIRNSQAEIRKPQFEFRCFCLKGRFLSLRRG